VSEPTDINGSSTWTRGSLETMSAAPANGQAWNADAPPHTDEDAPSGANNTKPKAKKSKPRDMPEVTHLWEKRLTRDKDGLASSVGNISLILQHHARWVGQLRYDVRADKVILHPGAPIADSETPRELRDSDHARIAIWLEQSEYSIVISPGSAAITGALAVIAELSSFDPVKDYLDGLTWDGTPRLDGMLLGYFGAQLKEEPAEREAQARYLAQAGSKFLISAVARTYQPGCKVDHVLVLQGHQGIGKGSAIEILAGKEFYADGIPDLRNKDSQEFLLGIWIVELGELAALNRIELETMKAFITRSTDRYRSSFGRRTQAHPRRSVFAATTNDDVYLRDSTGNRRFWPARVTKIDLEALKRDRDQLWAESAVRYRAGEPWHFTDQAIVAAATEVQADHTVVDVWHPKIETWVSGRSRVAVAEVLEQGIGLDLPKCGQVEANRVARVLTQLGWTRRRAGASSADPTAKRPWLYFAPVEGQP